MSGARSAADHAGPDARRRAILDAAARRFAVAGVELTSIDDIARSLGATKGKIYHHFGSKGELVRAIRLHSVQLTHDHVLPAYRGGGDPATRLHRMAAAHVEVMMQALAYHRVVVETMRAHPHRGATQVERSLAAQTRALQGTYEDLFRDVIREGIESGVFAGQNLSIALHSLMMLLNAPVYWYRPRLGERGTDRDAIKTQIAAMALGALRAAPGD
ncbi:TetR/AcrR family transcriptional regulator [Profundibacterium mesophilum]|uniref:Pantoate--beta-alanine ligase n=1 Tax=Profundibacterium mesophilum KAUST100406-0324 TaxID=1037889 RepID=A0A921NNW7_9RHOB|nr:TetR/AcrR family transcriptional regulator [Profundibacterium mesophilum]KAF0674602.1 pantoate--beta-alanine ligase [Profundibacterium mesophilum KAUST100406-0324]